MAMDRSEIEKLADAIIAYRARNGLNQTEFAALCGLTKPTIGAIESGRHGVTRVTKVKILNVISTKEE